MRGLPINGGAGPRRSAAYDPDADVLRIVDAMIARMAITGVLFDFSGQPGACVVALPSLSAR
jgi:hypothetical protein